MCNNLNQARSTTHIFKTYYLKEKRLIKLKKKKIKTKKSLEGFG